MMVAVPRTSESAVVSLPDTLTFLMKVKVDELFERKASLDTEKSWFLYRGRARARADDRSDYRKASDEELVKFEKRPAMKRGVSLTQRIL